MLSRQGGRDGEVHELCREMKTIRREALIAQRKRTKIERSITRQVKQTKDLQVKQTKDLQVKQIKDLQVKQIKDLVKHAKEIQVKKTKGQVKQTKELQVKQMRTAVTWPVCVMSQLREGRSNGEQLRQGGFSEHDQ